MSLQGTVQRGRRMAESLMQDTFTAYSPNGTTTDADGYKDPAYVNQGSTPGKTQGGSAASADTVTQYVKIGGIDRPIQRGGLHIPAMAFRSGGRSLIVAGEYGLGWEFECTALGALSSGDLGARFLVVGVDPKTYLTARRLDVVEL